MTNFNDSLADLTKNVLPDPVQSSVLRTEARVVSEIVSEAGTCLVGEVGNKTLFKATLWCVLASKKPKKVVY